MMTNTKMFDCIVKTKARSDFNFTPEISAFKPVIPAVGSVSAKAMTPQEAMQMLKRKQAEARLQQVKDAFDKAQRAKELLRERLSQEAIFSVVYVPFVIAEVAWDYIDSILDISAYLKIHETKRLCRAMKELRQQYDRDRYRIITDSCRESETENMIMFQDELKDFFSKMYKAYKFILTQTHGKIVDDMLMIVASVYVCRTVFDALFKYEAAQMKCVSRAIGYEIDTLLPDTLRKMNDLVIEFAGDCRMPPDYKSLQERFAKELTEYIIDVEINDLDKQEDVKPKASKTKKVSTPKQIRPMKEIVNDIKSVIADLTADLDKSANGNKRAGVRARKASVKLEKLMKEYRKASLQ